MVIDKYTVVEERDHKRVILGIKPNITFVLCKWELYFGLDLLTLESGCPLCGCKSQI